MATPRALSGSMPPRPQLDRLAGEDDTRVAGIKACGLTGVSTPEPMGIWVLRLAEGRAPTMTALSHAATPFEAFEEHVALAEKRVTNASSRTSSHRSACRQFSLRSRLSAPLYQARARKVRFAQQHFESILKNTLACGDENEAGVGLIRHTVDTSVRKPGELRHELLPGRISSIDTLVEHEG